MTASAPGQHELRFLAHLDRVRGLVELYGIVVGAGQGRPSVRETDLLRGAVVLLHACLEDLIRELVAERLPGMTAERLDGIPVMTQVGKPEEKVSLKGLAAFRGQTIDMVVQESVGAFLDRSSYNHPGDIERALERIDLPIKIEKPLRTHLAALMVRRHHIAHRLDRNERAGRGHHPARSLGRSTVERWIEILEELGRDILSKTETRIAVIGRSGS